MDKIDELNRAIAAFDTFVSALAKADNGLVDDYDDTLARLRDAMMVRLGRLHHEALKAREQKHEGG